MARKTQGEEQRAIATGFLGVFTRLSYEDLMCEDFLKIYWFMHLTKMLSAPPLRVPVIFLVQKICPVEHRLRDTNSMPSSRAKGFCLRGRRGL